VNQDELLPYVIELGWLTERCTASAQMLDAQLSRPDPPSDLRRYSRRVFQSLQEILSSAAAVARILVPLAQSRAEKGLPRAQATVQANWRVNRGGALRSALDIHVQDIPTVLDREMRNTMEHFEEYIDVLVRGGFTGSVVDRSIYEESYLQFVSDGDIQILRRIDPETRIAHVGSVRIDVNSLVSEMKIVADATRQWGQLHPEYNIQSSAKGSVLLLGGRNPAGSTT
jgi:hypothetical protein